MIGMALSCNPRLLIADEPTTALDVTIQAEILSLLARLKEEYRIAMLLITHDLAVVAEVADSVAVMYAGQIVEEAPVRTIFESPHHPYTRGLLQSIPRIAGDQDRRRLPTIEGSVPGLIDIPAGCRFAPRCPYRMPACTTAEIPFTSLTTSDDPALEHHSRCILDVELQADAREP